MGGSDEQQPGAYFASEKKMRDGDQLRGSGSSAPCESQLSGHDCERTFDYVCTVRSIHLVLAIGGGHDGPFHSSYG